MEMVRYFIKRLGMMLIAMFFIILVTFTIMHAIPGGPFTSDRKVSEEVEAALNEKYHLDRPLPEQFFEYLGGVLHGDLGPSYKYTGKEVNEFIRTGFPVSAKLGGITIIFVLLAAVPMGILAAVKNGKWQDMLVMAFATIGVTIPSFVIASLLIYTFSFRLNILPTFGIDTWKGYVLPVIALGGYSLSYLARLMRSSLLEVMGQDYIRTARAKGLSETRVILHHAMRNALSKFNDGKFCYRKDFCGSGSWGSLCQQRVPEGLYHDYGSNDFLCRVFNGHDFYRGHLLLSYRSKD